MVRVTSPHPTNSTYVEEISLRQSDSTDLTTTLHVLTQPNFRNFSFNRNAVVTTPSMRIEPRIKTQERNSITTTLTEISFNTLEVLSKQNINIVHKPYKAVF